VGSFGLATTNPFGGWYFFNQVLWGSNSQTH
jgi:hypothetical protein